MAAKGSKKGGVSNYFKGIRSEMRKVTWPSTKELVNYTGVVMLISAFVSLIVHLLDFLIHGGLSFIF